MSQYLDYLAIDLGAESGRTILGAIVDGRLKLTEIHRFANGPVRLVDGLHWDVLRLWGEIKTGIRLSAGKTKLTSLGLDTWGVDFGLLGRTGELLGTPYHYRDARTDGMVEEAFKKVRREDIFRQTGVQFMQLNTLYQLYAMVLAKSSVLESAERFVTIPDLFNYWLSGMITNEFSIATTTQCYNPLSRDWARGLLEALEIPSRLFGPIIQPGTSLGNIIPEIAAETGSGVIRVVAPACHDTGSAVVAVPAENVDFAWLSSGTWSILGAEVRHPVLSEKALEYNFTNEGGVAGTWRLSKNITGLWLVQGCKREWNLGYEELTHLASKSKPFLAVIDPDDIAFLHPGNMPGKIREYCRKTGQAIPETQGEVVRVVLESLALKYRLGLERLEELAGKRLEPLHIIGGGTKNRLLNQFTADSCGRTVITGPVEATAIGNILMQAITLGEIGSLGDARQIVHRSFEIEEYHPSQVAGWDEIFQKFKSLMT